jgi:hypothetical protein
LIQPPQPSRSDALLCHMSSRSGDIQSWAKTNLPRLLLTVTWSLCIMPSSASMLYLSHFLPPHLAAVNLLYRGCTRRILVLAHRFPRLGTYMLPLHRQTSTDACHLMDLQAHLIISCAAIPLTDFSYAAIPLTDFSYAAIPLTDFGCCHSRQTLVGSIMRCHTKGTCTSTPVGSTTSIDVRDHTYLPVGTYPLLGYKYFHSRLTPGITALSNTYLSGQII